MKLVIKSIVADGALDDLSDQGREVMDNPNRLLHDVFVDSPFLGWAGWDYKENLGRWLTLPHTHPEKRPDYHAVVFFNGTEYVIATWHEDDTPTVSEVDDEDTGIDTMSSSYDRIYSDM